jgi:voltage-gated potassium channel
LPLFRLLDRLIQQFTRASWLSLLLFLAALYAMGAAVLLQIEPTESGFDSLATYSWWFIVTITTVGYGDLMPATNIGRVAAGVIMIGGIASVGVALGKLGELVFALGRRKMRGEAQLHESDHVVIVGYRKGETERLVEELQGDVTWSRKSIVICSSECAENPLPDRARFARGDLTSDDLLQRSCISDAALIVIFRNDDTQTIVSAIAVTSANSTAHIVAAIDNPDSQRHLQRVSPRIECVVPLAVPMIVQALQDPGTTRVVQELLSNLSENVLYRLEVPAEVPNLKFGTLLSALNQQHGAIALAVGGSKSAGAELSLNPHAGLDVLPGMVLYYVGTERLTSLNWAALAEAN